VEKGLMKIMEKLLKEKELKNNKEDNRYYYNKDITTAPFF
jgi:hypothetical protein